MRLFGWFSVAMLLASPLAAADELSGRRAPGFSLPDLNLNQHDLADFRGKLLLLDFMKTDCPHCQTLSRLLEEVKAKYGSKVAILSVVMPPDNQSTVLRFIQANFLTTTVLFDCGQMAASYLKATPRNPSVEMPHLFIIDGMGIIRHDYAYEPSRELFENQGLFKVLDSMLAGPPAGKKK